MTDHGIFTLYRPEGLDMGSVLCLRNAQGADWYQLCHDHGDAPGAWVALSPSGVVEIACAVPDQMFPVDRRVMFLAGRDAQDMRGMMLADGAFVPAPKPAPAWVRRDQAAAELLARDLVSEDDAVLLAGTGATPLNIVAMIAPMPASERGACRLAMAPEKWHHADIARQDMLVRLLAPASVDDFFIAAARR